MIASAHWAISRTSKSRIPSFGSLLVICDMIAKPTGTRKALVRPGSLHSYKGLRPNRSHWQDFSTDLASDESQCSVQGYFGFPCSPEDSIQPAAMRGFLKTTKTWVDDLRNSAQYNRTIELSLHLPFLQRSIRDRICCRKLPYICVPVCCLHVMCCRVPFAYAHSDLGKFFDY